MLESQTTMLSWSSLHSDRSLKKKNSILVIRICVDSWVNKIIHSVICQMHLVIIFQVNKHLHKVSQQVQSIHEKAVISLAFFFSLFFKVCHNVLELFSQLLVF